MRSLVIATLLLAGPTAAAQPPDNSPILGEWRGLGIQVGPDGPQSSWDIELFLQSESAGVISYPSLDCKSELTRVEGSSRQIVLTEHITEGDCIDGGRVTVIMENGRLFWFWTSPDFDADASAVLYRGKPIS